MLSVVGVQRQQVVYLLYYISIPNTYLFDNQVCIFFEISVFPPILPYKNTLLKTIPNTFILGKLLSITTIIPFEIHTEHPIP